jgi:hypothetical protein
LLNFYQVDWTVQVRNSDNLPANKVAQAIQSGSENEAIANPNTRLDIFSLLA